jgi:hypothetical protein
LTVNDGDVCAHVEGRLVRLHRLAQSIGVRGEDARVPYPVPFLLTVAIAMGTFIGAASNSIFGRTDTRSCDVPSLRWPSCWVSWSSPLSRCSSPGRCRGRLCSEGLRGVGL